MAEQRRWGYTVRRWHDHPHYHVSIFPDVNLRAVFDYSSGVMTSQRFNTKEEANNFIVSLRRRLKRKGIELKSHARDYCS